MQNPERFKSLLESDLKEYKESQNVTYINILCELLAYYAFDILVTDEETCEAMLSSKIQYETKLSNIYLEQGLEDNWSNSIERIEVLQEYLKLFNNG